MLVNTKEVAKAILAVKQPRQKAIGVSVRKGRLVVRGCSQYGEWSATWEQPLSGDVTDLDEQPIEHRLLAGIVKAAPDELNLESIEEGIHLWTEGAYWRLKASGDELPADLPVGGGIKLRLELPINRFLEIVALLATSASSDDTHPVLTTAVIAHDGERLVACATDTYRLRVIPLDKYCTKGGVDLGDWTQVETLPVSALKAAARAIAELPKKGPEPVRLQLRANAWTVSCGPVRLVAGYGGGEYPNASKVIPDQADTDWTLTVDADELRTALAGLGPIAAEDSNRVVLGWDGGRTITLKADIPDPHQSALMRLSCRVGSRKKERETAFSYRYMLDGLSGREGEVRLEQGTYLNPILLDFGAEGLYVIMPMSVM